MKDTFGQYGLSFKAPEFNLGGMGRLYVNKVRRDELIDLARKKRLQDKYGEDFVLSGAPVKPVSPDFGPEPLEVPEDPLLTSSGLFGTADGFRIAGGDISGAGDQYMDDLAAFQDPGYAEPTETVYGPGEEAPLVPGASFRMLEDGSTVVTRGVGYPDPEMDEYNKQKAIYDELVAAGFTPGGTLGQQTLNQLAQVETIGADQDYTMRELGYEPPSRIGGYSRGVTGNKLLDQENRKNAKEAKDKADAAWYKLGRMADEGKADTAEYQELRAEADAYASTYTQFSGKEYKKPVGAARELIYEDERRKDETLDLSKKKVTLGVRNKILDRLKDARDKLLKDRESRVESYNTSADFADQFVEVYNEAGDDVAVLPSNSATALIVAFRKILEPTSAVLQGEANAMLGQGVINNIVTAIGQLKAVVTKYTSLDTPIDEIRVSEMTQEAKRELGRVYNAIATTFEGLKDNIEKGIDTYMDSVTAEIREGYAEYPTEGVEKLLNSDRSQKIINTRLNLKPLPKKVTISNAPVIKSEKGAGAIDPKTPGSKVNPYRVKYKNLKMVLGDKKTKEGTWIRLPNGSAVVAGKTGKSKESPFVVSNLKMLKLYPSNSYFVLESEGDGPHPVFYVRRIPDDAPDEGQGLLKYLNQTGHRLKGNVFEDPKIKEGN